MNQVASLVQKFQKVLNECPEIVFIGDPVLRCKTESVSADEKVRISEQLKKTLLRYREVTGIGRGLAAPQIGYSKSIFVTFVNDSLEVYANPQITFSSKEVNWYRESCISCGFLSADVARSREIKITYENEAGKQCEVKADGFLARLLQHEYDHLQGVINIDRAELGSIEFAIQDPLREVLREQKQVSNR